MISMKNEKIIASWQKVKPSDSASERMLAAIIEKNRSANSNKSPKSRFRWGLIAAGLVLVTVITTATFMISAEAREYRDAIAFFEENGLSAEGLSRAEIKAVYRDITEKRFSYGKTAEVIQKAVPGWEILQDEPTPEELAALWDKNIWMNSITDKGISYRTDSTYVYDESRGFEVFEKSMLECYQDGKKIWTAEFRDFYVEGYARTKNGTAVWGSNLIMTTSDRSYGWVAYVDRKGNIMWQRPLDHGFKSEYVASMLNNGDGTWAVISRGDLKYLCLSYYDDAGNELSFHKTEVGNFGINNAAKLGDGYIVQLWNQFSGDTALLYKMDREGQITDSFAYEGDDCEYYITDLREFGGQVYLSAYTTPKQKDEGGRHEIANILDYVISKKNWEISSEELTPLVRDNYTAVLLVCDPEGGTPKTFYSVKGSLGSRVSINTSGQLEWDVESITSTFFSPATSSFTIGGLCKVYRYVFDAEGHMISQSDTGETTPYRR